MRRENLLLIARLRERAPAHFVAALLEGLEWHYAVAEKGALQSEKPRKRTSSRAQNNF
jgi:hypothetical protein